MRLQILCCLAFLFSACSVLPTETAEEANREIAKLHQEVIGGKTEIRQEKTIVRQEIEKETKIVKQETKKEIKKETKIVKKDTKKIEKKIVKVEKKIEKKTEKKKVVKQLPAKSGKNLLLVGDSVMLGSKKQLQKMFPGAIVDASVSRQFTKLPAILRAQKKKHGTLPSVVVVHLGTNGTVRESSLAEAMKILGPKRRVYFVNCKVEKKWEKPVNRFLAKGVKNYPNATLIDWYGKAHGQKKYFWKDGVHPNKVGAREYRNLIRRRVEKEL